MTINAFKGAFFYITALTFVLLLSAMPVLAEQDDDPMFNIWEYRIGGNTLLENVDIERAVYQFLGPQKSIGDVENARLALETLYRDKGFPTALVDIPEQDVEDGIVRLRVSEGRLARVRATGARYYSNARILAKIPSAREGVPLDAKALQEQLGSLAKRARNRTILPVLRAGREPGTVDLDLKVDDTAPITASLELNNKASVDTEDLRLNASIDYNNLWQKDHSIGFQFQTSPEDTSQVEVLGATYLIRPEHSDTIHALYAVESNSDFIAAGEFGVLGNGRIFGYRAVLPLPALGKLTPGSVSLGFDYKDFADSIALDADDSLDTDIDYLMFSAAVSAGLITNRHRLGFDAGAYFGVRDVVNQRDEFENKRFRGAPNFVYLRGGLQHAWSLTERWQLNSRAVWQLTAAPLISNEQLSAGGASTVRGYFEAEQFADYGLVAGTELNYRFNFSPDAFINSLRIGAFADWSGLANHKPLPGEPRRFELASAGMGLGFDTTANVSGLLEYAWPLHDASRTEADDARLLFSLRYRVGQ